MSTTHPRANLKIPRADFVYLDRVAREDGNPSATAYLRKLIAADRVNRARAEAEAMLLDVYRRDALQGSDESNTINAAVNLFELLTDGDVPDVPPGAHPHTAAHVILAQLAARILVDGAAHERHTGDDLPLGAFITALADDERVTLGAMRGLPSAIGNIINALIDLLGERALVEAAQQPEGKPA